MDKKQRIGRMVKCSTAEEHYYAYLPEKLPPNPPLDMNEIYPLLEKANIALGRLDGMSMILPDPTLFLYMYVRKEAVLSSQIEGTQSSLSDLLLYENKEAHGVPIDDVQEVSNYVSAMYYGLQRLETFPLSLRLIREIHEKLMAGSRGGNKMLGEFRTSQNWIGGSRPAHAMFVPPPPEHLIATLDSFEKFLHEDTIKMPALVRAALAHVQFETIHPFLDGNGRVGRLLITFILCHEGILKQPLLYLSLYFKANRQAYYNHLQSVRETGDWESWVQFFLTGVVDTANQATETAQAILHLFEQDRRMLAEAGKPTAAIMSIHSYFEKHPISNTTRIKEACGISLPTVMRSLASMEKQGIIEEITGKERHKMFVYRQYLDILNKGTEPLRY